VVADSFHFHYTFGRLCLKLIFFFLPITIPVSLKYGGLAPSKEKKKKDNQISKV
jgi:hypothetical protein